MVNGLLRAFCLGVEGFAFGHGIKQTRFGIVALATELFALLSQLLGVACAIRLGVQRWVGEAFVDGGEFELDFFQHALGLSLGSGGGFAGFMQVAARFRRAGVRWCSTVAIAGGEFLV